MAAFPDKRRRSGQDRRKRRSVSPARDIGSSRSRARTASRLARAWRRVRGALRTLPLPLRVFIGVLAICVALVVINLGYQVIRKPTELFFPVSGALAKSPPETWRTYGSLFNAHATKVITPDLLAALAQVESAGNPVARTYWRWHPTANPLAWYRPASSAVGMYQITDGTFQEAKRYCIHDHVVVETGAWHDLDSCWFNSLYTRVLPTHAIELTAAWLDRSVARALVNRDIAAATLQQQQDLAAVIHLCGPRAGEVFAAQGFRLTAQWRQCGDHDVRRYLAHVNAFRRQFARLAGAG